MGNMSTILAALFCATAPVAAVDVIDSKTEQAQPSARLGKETVSVIRQAYEKGDYNEFLTEMNISYEKAMEENGLEGLIQMRKQEIPANFQEKWEQKFIELQKQRNAQLNSVLSDQDDSLFAQKVRSLAADLSTPEQEKAISKLHSLVAKTPGSGINDDENTLIDLDLEYEFKLLNAQMPLSDVSPDQILQHQIALRMEKMDRMIEASKNFKDASLKQAVSLASANLDERLARNLDGMDLNNLVKSHAKASNETEEKVFSILESYQSQFTDLMKQLGNEAR
jgi:hypothetical protein